MTDKATSYLWWKNAVIYCADVATWEDSDGHVPLPGDVVKGPGALLLAGERRFAGLLVPGIAPARDQPVTYLRSLVEFLQRRRDYAIFLGEANVSPGEQQRCFASARTCHCPAASRHDSPDRSEITGQIKYRRRSARFEGLFARAAADLAVHSAPLAQFAGPS